MGCSVSVPRVGSAGQDDNQPAARVTQKGLKSEVLSAGRPATGLIRATDASVKPVGTNKDRQRSRKARARRLSYVDHEEEARFQDGRANPIDAEETEDGESNGDDSGAARRKRTKGARQRRLSYVIDGEEQDVERKLKAAGSSRESGEVPRDQPRSIPRLEPGRVIEASSSGGKPAPPLAGPSYSMACVSRAGREPGFKKQNQDNCFAFDRYAREGQALVGAFDGHGPEGHTVSAFIKEQLPLLLLHRLGTASPNVPDALRRCFLDVDAAMTAAGIDCEFSGSTACVALLSGQDLNVAWVGDSRGVLGRKSAAGFEAVDLTKDHKPVRPEEKARILANNGRVERLVDEAGQPIGPFRVWLQYAWIPGLAMSRALGDALAHQVGVTSEPEVVTHTLGPDDAFIILASDGVWEFIESQEAADIVGSAANAQDGCRQLVDEAFQRWLVEEDGVVDDITAVVVKFSHAS